MTRDVAVDWDDTLVGAKTQEWLPGAKVALHRMLGDYRVVRIHTCRANWPEGHAAVEAQLSTVPVFRQAIRDGRIEIDPKPAACVYVGDNYATFDGDWPRTLRRMREVQK